MLLKTDVVMCATVIDRQMLMLAVVTISTFQTRHAHSFTSMSGLENWWESASEAEKIWSVCSCVCIFMYRIVNQFTVKVFKPSSKLSTASSSRMRLMNHNWSATKQRLHPQSVAEISRHSVLPDKTVHNWWMVNEHGLVAHSRQLELQHRNSISQWQWFWNQCCRSYRIGWIYFVAGWCKRRPESPALVSLGFVLHTFVVSISC